MLRVAVIGSTACIEDGMLLCEYEDCDVLIISYLSCKMLCESALGISIVNDALLKGIPVYVLKNGMEYMNVNDINLHRMYSVYRRQLQLMGVKFTDDIGNCKGKYMGDKKR